MVRRKRGVGGVRLGWAGFPVEEGCWSRWVWVAGGMVMVWLRNRELGVRRGMAEVSIL